MHHVLGFWLFGLWINIQKIPERLFPKTPFVHKYMSSDILKGVIVAICIIMLNYLLFETVKLADIEKSKFLINNPDIHADHQALLQPQMHS